MNSKEVPAINHDEIARLAHLNWEKDGHPHGHDLNYWLEAEQQIRATKHLLTSELAPPVNQTLAAAKLELNGKLKKSRRRQRERSV